MNVTLTDWLTDLHAQVTKTAHQEAASRIATAKQNGRLYHGSLQIQPKISDVDVEALRASYVRSAFSRLTAFLVEQSSEEFQRKLAEMTKRAEVNKQIIERIEVAKGAALSAHR